ncbi:Cytidine deaminase [Galdieria sulphuraria]|uniref:Cytidine deaminase n=1 Tax=Galdieria sulphuraria TaxID=130081 RepID=M2XY11_GALSU|nr:cytidine deaminase [Galdieria sulphuraria]EME28324.1 cytidine deaminase [Galdieria sulphuraria]GJD12511.1 Cytidine deaminase [Galdieria sulphuraria]|eukprot:XP_005704844.1 cytidine deaminase [Galdieria sulphuraria]
MEDDLENYLGEQTLQDLKRQAVEVKKNAYVPYSHFPVGACICAQSGQLYSGCNVENASYGLSICAERTAVVKAVSEGNTCFRAIAISTDTTGEVWPCGACRQFLSEFGNFPVIFIGHDGSIRVEMVNHLLPRNFSKADLKTVKDNKI